MFDAVTTMTDYARAGTVRGLATTGAVRSDILPDVPTMSEAGVAGYETTIWLGLMAPKGTPVSIINRLNATMTAIVTRPEIKKQWAEKGATPLTMSPLEFQSYLERDVVKWAKIVTLSGAKPD
jgi:tripartite-type tricarboxylate transporter receptor subunit TctC